MNKLWEAIRKTTDKALISAGRKINNATNGHAAKQIFVTSVKHKKVPTNVKIISENEESVTIAKVGSDGKILNNGFRILTTTDLHLGDDASLRNKTFQMLFNHINATRPDLVLLTGDIILSKYQHFDAIQFAEFMEEIGIYWGFVFGNHESREEKGDFKYLLMKCQTDYPHCITRQGRKDLFGYCNYTINILSGENSLLKTLVCLDSGRDAISEYAKENGAPENFKGYDYIKKSQIEWYESKIGELKNKYGEAKSFMYMHIPLKEYEEVIYTDGNMFPFTDKCEVLYGGAYEAVGSSGYNSGMFDSIKKNGTEAVFSGHDHVNDFCAIYDGVYLVYNQCGGYETYTMEDKLGWKEKDWMQGATVTEIKPDGSFDISQRFSSMYLK